MISAAQMSSFNDSQRRNQERTGTARPTSEPFVDPTEELLNETTFSRWSSQKTPAFPLPLNSTSPKFPTRQASAGYQDKQQPVSFFEDSFAESVAPPVPQQFPLSDCGLPPSQLKRSRKGFDSEIDGSGRAARRESVEEQLKLGGNHHKALRFKV